jgi:hypothetical protein
LPGQLQRPDTTPKRESAHIKDTAQRMMLSFGAIFSDKGPEP